VAERNIFARAVDYMMPGLAIKRERLHQARAMLQDVRAEYAAARRNRANDGWYVPSSSANTEVSHGLVMLRDRARSLVRDNPYAERIVTVWRAHLVGNGIIAEPQTGDETLDEKLRTAWQAFADDGECDADGLNDLYGLQGLVSDAVVTDGECLVRVRTRRVADGYRVPMQLQILEADHLDHTRNSFDQSTGRATIMGIQLSPLGEREGYWIWRNHPGDNVFAFQQASVFVPADQILHIFRRRRPGQMRGVSWMHAVINTLRDLDDSSDARRFKMKVENCLALIVRGTAPESPLGQTTTKTRRDGSAFLEEELSPGLIKYVDGEDVTVVNPSSAGGHDGVILQSQQEIAIGVGLTYDQITGDLSRNNFASLRAGKIEFRRDLAQVQWQMMIPMLCEPVWNRWVDLGAAAGNWAAGPHRAEHMPPRNEPINPKVDTDADETDVDNGFVSWSEIVRGRGKDPKRHARELADERAMLKGLGLDGIIPSKADVPAPTTDPSRAPSS
jgi:lambda family phage portal protein